MKYQFLLVLACVLVSTMAHTNSTQAPEYHELYRPGYHYSCPKNWMNDPVGLVYFQGLYHLFYQYNPYSTIWGNMSWGHAASFDLVYWENLPVAISPYNLTTIFSGSNIVDVNNTSGFCTVPDVGCLIAFFTGHVDEPTQNETQNMAYSNDFGLTYTFYDHNPIVNESIMWHRDPKVFWYAPESKWIMLTAFPMQYSLRLYTSTDLKNWTHLSDFGPMGSEAGGWEDPDLYQLAVDNDTTKMKWVLSHAVAVNAVEYYIGDFDGTTFTETDNSTLYVDYGRDFDEAATFNDEPNGRRLMMAWLDEGQYGGELPERVWRGQLTLVRELNLKTFPEGVRMIQQPPDSYTKLRTSNNHTDNLTVTASANTTIINGTQLEIIAVFQPGKGVEAFGFNVFQGSNQSTIIGYNVTAGALWVDRTNSGVVSFDPTFAGITNATLDQVNGTINMRVFIDSSSVEVFANDGKIAMSNLIFPDPTQDNVSLWSVGGKTLVTSLDTWVLTGIWPNEIVQETRNRIDDFLALIDI